MFGIVKQLAQRGASVNEGRLVQDTFSDTSVKAEIIELNQKQLYELGVEADGSPTGIYSTRSMEYKEKVAPVKGYDTRTDHITLKDSGDMYNSMDVEATTDGPVIKADTNKNGRELTKQWPDALGLTDESKSEIIPTVKEVFLGNLRNAVLGE